MNTYRYHFDRIEDYLDFCDKNEDWVEEYWAYLDIIIKNFLDKPYRLNCFKDKNWLSIKAWYAWDTIPYNRNTFVVRF